MSKPLLEYKSKQTSLLPFKTSKGKTMYNVRLTSVKPWNVEDLQKYANMLSRRVKEKDPNAGFFRVTMMRLDKDGNKIPQSCKKVLAGQPVKLTGYIYDDIPEEMPVLYADFIFELSED